MKTSVGPQILQIMKGATRDRFEAIRPYVECGRVLDVGCVDARTQRQDSEERLEGKPNLLFRKLVEVNPDTVGVDVDADGVACLQRQGYQVHCADAEVMDLGERFTAIVAAEVIEHVENPGLFLRNLRRHLDEDGVLLVTTPNAFAARGTWKIWRYGEPDVHEDHTCWFDPRTLSELLRRTGFTPFAGYWLDAPRFRLRNWPRLFRSYFAKSFLIASRPTA